MYIFSPLLHKAKAFWQSYLLNAKKSRIINHTVQVYVPPELLIVLIIWSESKNIRQIFLFAVREVSICDWFLRALFCDYIYPSKHHVLVTGHVGYARTGWVGKLCSLLMCITWWDHAHGSVNIEASELMNMWPSCSRTLKFGSTRAIIWMFRSWVLLN